MLIALVKDMMEDRVFKFTVLRIGGAIDLMVVVGLVVEAEGPVVVSWQGEGVTTTKDSGAPVLHRGAS